MEERGPYQPHWLGSLLPCDEGGSAGRSMLIFGVKRFSTLGSLISPALLLQSPGLYCLPHDRPVNREMRGWGKEQLLDSESRWTEKVGHSCQRTILPELEFKPLS